MVFVPNTDFWWTDTQLLAAVKLTCSTRSASSPLKHVFGTPEVAFPEFAGRPQASRMRCAEALDLRGLWEAEGHSVRLPVRADTSEIRKMKGRYTYRQRVQFYYGERQKNLLF